MSVFPNWSTASRDKLQTKRQTRWMMQFVLFFTLVQSKVVRRKKRSYNSIFEPILIKLFYILSPLPDLGKLLSRRKLFLYATFLVIFFKNSKKLSKKIWKKNQQISLKICENNSIFDNSTILKLSPSQHCGIVSSGSILTLETIKSPLPKRHFSFHFEKSKCFGKEM